MKKIIVLCSIVLLLMPFTALGQDFCEGNFDYDRDQDGTDAFTFKTDFGRSSIMDPCPDDGPAPVEKSGQVTSYGTGDDGTLEKGVALPNPRFSDNGNGTIMDNLTGLTWLKDANCYGTRTWDQALGDCSGLTSGSCGLTDGSSSGDWRLPNVKELQSLIDFSQFGPALPSGHPFVNAQLDINHWSSTTVAFWTNIAWTVRIDSGYVAYDEKSGSYHVWPVRGGH
jgi:hypothetical protein